MACFAPNHVTKISLKLDGSFPRKRAKAKLLTMDDHAHPDPPWLLLLNSMQLEWRDAKLLVGRNPDPAIEELLRSGGRWPPAKGLIRIEKEARHF